MWYKKIYSIRKNLSIIKNASLGYFDWVRDILVSRKGKIFIKSFVYFVLPVLLLLQFGLLDTFLKKELLFNYALFYKAPRNFFDNYVIADFNQFKTKENLEEFLVSLKDSKPKLVVVDTIDNISVPSFLRVVTSASLPVDFRNRPQAWQSVEINNSRVCESGIIRTTPADKGVYGRGFLLVPNELSFTCFIHVQKCAYMSLSLAIVDAMDSWDSAYYDNGTIIAHKLRDNKNRILNLKNGLATINPFHNFSKLTRYKSLADLKNKVLIISDTRHKNIKVSSFLTLSRAEYIALTTQELYSNDFLPTISKYLIEFVLILMLSVVSVLNLFYRRRYRTLIFTSMLLFYIVLGVFLIKVAQLYIGFIPVLVPYVLSYFYGIFFTNRDETSRAKGNRELVLIGIDFIRLDKYLNTIVNEEARRDFYSNFDILRKKADLLKNSSSVVEYFDYSNKMFFLLERDNKFYGTFWEGLHGFIKYINKLANNYDKFPVPRIIGIEGIFYFYPKDNFWTGPAKDLFFNVRKHTDDDLVFDINIVPNGFINDTYKKLDIEGLKLYGRNL